MQLDGIDHVALSVRDVEHSARWYGEVLGFQRQHDAVWNGVPVFVGNETAAIALFPVRSGGTSASPGAPRILHFAFRTNGQQFNAAQQELRQRGIDFEFEDHQITHSIYFKDPDGHEIEITTYELK